MPPSVKRVPYTRSFVCVPADRTFVAVSAVVVACLVGCWIGRWDRRPRIIEGRTRKARIFAAEIMVASVVCSPCDVQWLRGFVVLRVKLPSLSRPMTWAWHQLSFPRGFHFSSTHVLFTANTAM